MILYDYERSTACYRVRIALNYKNIPYDASTVHLLNQGGEQYQPHYLHKNPQALVPTLEVENHSFSQSLAIIEYLEETYPNPPLLPNDPLARAEVRRIALIIACDIHPLNCLRVLQTLQRECHFSESQKQEWYHHWLKLGFDAIETLLARLPRKEGLCYGETVTMADLCLIPQVYNAHRFHFSTQPYPLIEEINAYCLRLPAFRLAAPKNVNDPRT